MKVSGYNLFLKTDSGVIGFKDGNSGDFTFSISEQKESDICIIKGYLTAHKHIEPVWLDVTIPVELSGLSFYANGFQSWSESPLIDKNKKMKNLWSLPANLFRLKYYGDYHFNHRVKDSKKAYSHLYIDLISEAGTKLFIGDLKPYDSYTMFLADYRNNIITAGSDLEGIMLDEGDSMEIFSVCVSKDADTWFGVLGIERLKAGKLTGWTSWYNYYTKITEYILESNMKALSKANTPMDVFQIDDGYFTHVGDWLESNDRFPGGMKAVADKIKKHGWTAGLWSAPFITDNKSSIFNEKSGWIVKTSDGKLQIAGWNPNWNGVFYSLDIYNEEFREYLRAAYDTSVNEWGYGFLKLDFLYAAGLQPREGKTRCMIMADAMDFLLEITQGAKILACGVPIAPAMGKCHYCRIGGDISHGWEDGFLKTINYRERVSTVSSLGNTRSRYFLNGRAFLNDPDVFILRDSKEIKLTDEQKEILFSTNLSKSGLVFFSDDISSYDDNLIKKVNEAFTGFRE